MVLLSLSEFLKLHGRQNITCSIYRWVWEAPLLNISSLSKEERKYEKNEVMWAWKDQELFSPKKSPLSSLTGLVKFMILPRPNTENSNTYHRPLPGSAPDSMKKSFPFHYDGFYNKKTVSGRKIFFFSPFYFSHSFLIWWLSSFPLILYIFLSFFPQK